MNDVSGKVFEGLKMERCYLLRDGGGRALEGHKAYMCIDYTSDNRSSDIISLLALLTGMSATELRNARRPSQSIVDDLHVHVTEFRWGR